MSDDDLKLWKELSTSAEAILAIMKGKKFSGATGIRNHARFIDARAGLRASVEESRREFKRLMKREREKSL
jgi:hypothetical protein